MTENRTTKNAKTKEKPRDNTFNENIVTKITK